VRPLLPKSDKQKIAEAFHASKVDDFVLPPWDYNVIRPSFAEPVHPAFAHNPQCQPNTSAAPLQLVLHGWLHVISGVLRKFSTAYRVGEQRRLYLCLRLLSVHVA
jgi:hypothetical protein